MSSITAESCVQAFLLTWVARFGVPFVLTWNTVYGLRLDPQSNGMIERFHRSLKTALCACLAGLDWFIHLPLFPRRTWGSPSQRLCLVFLLPFLESSRMMVSFRPLSSYRRLSWLSPVLAQPAPLPPALLAAKYVFVRKNASIPPLDPLYHGPYLVLERWKKSSAFN